jgi:hypothetical protein
VGREGISAFLQCGKLCGKVKPFCGQKYQRKAKINFILTERLLGDKKLCKRLV